MSSGPGQVPAGGPGAHFVARGHLTGRDVVSPPIARYDPVPDLAGLVWSYWVPVWDFAGREPQVQRTLQSPAPLLVVADSYARFYGVTRGMSRVELAGRGWAFGVRLRAAAGRALWRAPLTGLTDGFADLTEVPALDGAALRDEITAVMAPDPASPAAHRRAMDVLHEHLRPLLPVPEAGLLLNQIVDLVDTGRVRTVAGLVEATGLGERQVQRQVRDGLGLNPSWLLARRRVQDAALALKQNDASLSEIAHAAGYTDQAHFTRDFRQVTGMTPGEYRGLQP